MNEKNPLYRAIIALQLILTVTCVRPVLAADASFESEELSLRQQLSALTWTKGPTTVSIIGNSSLVVPRGYLFLDASNTDKYSEIMHNIPTGREVMLAPNDLRWSAYLSFSPEGYVKDDDNLDAAAILKQLKDATNQENEERRRRGWSPLTIIDWATPPHYSSTTKRLEWATLLQTSEGRNVNFLTKILGRHGVTSVVLVTDPESLAVAELELNKALAGYSFNPGETYAEYREGDKVAEYGLAALIVGGAAAIATKKGFWAVAASFIAAAWKIMLAAVVAAAGWVGSLFRRKSQ